MEQIKKLIGQDWRIRWVGYAAPRTVNVHMVNANENIKKIRVSLRRDYTDESFVEILSSYADRPGSNVGTIWSSESELDTLRLAAIVGLNVGGDATPGCNKSPIGTTSCVMAYDIECDRSRIPSSSFVTLSEKILSIATYCSCGDIQLFSPIKRVEFEYVQCRDSRETVSKFLQYVSHHVPQWLVGYNNFSFDNPRIAICSDTSHDNMFRQIKTGGKSSRQLAYLICIDGVYNVDLLSYLDRTSRSKYQNLSLSSVASSEGIGNKIDFDTLHISDFRKLFEYNIQDSKITMLLAKERGILSMICNICTVTSSPVIDVNRFMSGTFSCSGVASWCLANSIRMDWSKCSQFVPYQGAHVISPHIGMHSNVYSCDFSSMYPTILMSANISLENYRILPAKKSDGSIWQTKDRVNFTIGELTYSFDAKEVGILPKVISYQVSERKKIKQSQPEKAAALKLSANSLYGSTGDKNSFMYSPGCSASITSGGRWCLAVAESVLSRLGYKILYGDTDSAHVVSTNLHSASYADIKSCMKILSRIFDYTPFKGMSMELECVYDKIAYFGKKTYFGMQRSIQSNGLFETEAKMVSKGMSKSRKDRIGISRMLSAHVMNIVASNIELVAKQTALGDMISTVVDMATNNSLLLKDVSKIVKKSGQNYFQYVSSSGTREYMECEQATGEERVSYSAQYVCNATLREVGIIVRITSIGDIPTLISMSSII